MRYIFALIHVGLRLNCAAGEKSAPDFISLTLRSLISSQHNYRKNVWLSFNIKNSKICQQISISEFSLQCSSHYVVKGIPAFSTFSNESKAFDRNNCNILYTTGVDSEESDRPNRPPPKTRESNFIHHTFVQSGKQHLRYKAIWWSIVLSQQ